MTRAVPARPGSSCRVWRKGCRELPGQAPSGGHQPIELARYFSQRRMARSLQTSQCSRAPERNVPCPTLRPIRLFSGLRVPSPRPAARERLRTSPAHSRGSSIPRRPIRRALPGPNALPVPAPPTGPINPKPPTATRRAPKHAARARATARLHPIQQSPHPPRTRGRPRMANLPNLLPQRLRPPRRRPKPC